MALNASKLSIGDTYCAVVVENLTRTQIVMYAGASGDFHPFHHDEVYCKAMGVCSLPYPALFTQLFESKLFGFQ